jgi:putative FmdB family regulatory protein
VARYDYRCDRDGAFEITAPLGAAPSASACPHCGGQARRLFAAPMLKTVPRALVAAFDHEEKTRYAPDVVTSLPPASARRRMPMAPLTPALRRLPRP